MSQIKRDFDLLSEEQRASAIDAIIDYFTVERDEEIGVIAAGELLDMFLQFSGPAIYNNGINAAVALIADRLEEAKTDIEITLKRNSKK